MPLGTVSSVTEKAAHLELGQISKWLTVFVNHFRVIRIPVNSLRINPPERALERTRIPFLPLTPAPDGLAALLNAQIRKNK